MDPFFNKTLTFQKAFLDDVNKQLGNPPVQKTLPKSKSSNELAVKKNEKENAPNNVFLNSWGFNRNGQLGNSSSVLKTSQMNLLKCARNINDKPIYASAGENHTAILTNKLKLYMSGSNSFGQLGIEDVVNTLKPTIIPSLSHLEIVLVSCGSDFTYAMSSKGEVFSWGSNFKGQLGQGDYENRFSPCSVYSMAPFGIISSKSTAKNAQLSHKRNKSSNTNPYQKYREKSHSVDFNNTNDPILKKIEETRVLLGDDERVSNISCGALHTLIKTDKNRLFACGFGETYALGNGETKNLTEFEPVNISKTATSRQGYQKGEEIEKIASGLTHSGCIKSGKVYLWGLFSNREASALKVPTPIDFSSSGGGRKVENEYFVDLALGDTLSVFLTSKGEVYTLGENIDGQLGIPNISSTDLPLRVNHLPTSVNQIASGRNHVFAINTDTKQVYGWGSNLFGQLSIKNRGQNVTTPKLISSLSEMDIFKITCGSFHTLALSYMPSPVEVEDNDLLSDEEKSAPLNMGSQLDIQKYQEEVEKLLNEIEKLKAKNHFLTIENDKLRGDNKSDIFQKGSKRSACEVAVQVNLEEKKSGELEFKNRNRRDRSPDPKPQRVLHPQVEIDFKEITLEKQISEGGYGLIYKGRWRETVVAIKMLKIDMKEEHVRDFIYECYTMESLRHPNIVMFLGACTKPPNLAIVLEYCSRGSLWSALQNPDLKLSWEDRRRMALDTARGVNYLHSFSTPVLHRDLKSLNLLLDDNYRIKVADFGWTRTMAATMTGKIGTYQWMAPEVISGHNYTEKADVFSFGIVLWEVASREPPYRNINGLQVSIEVVQNDLRPTIPKKTPEVFTRLIKRCWDRDPEKRPSFKEIIKELETMKFEY